MGVSLVASSDVRRLGGAMGVVLAMPEAWEVTSEASSDVRRAMGVSSDVRGLRRAVGVSSVTSEVWEVTSEDREGLWVWF